MDDLQTNPSNAAPTTLHRSRQDRLLFGVCGGLGEYFAIDPVLVRLLFVLATVAGGSGILAYVVLAIVLPEEGRPAIHGRAAVRGNLEDLQDAAGSLGADLSAPSGQRSWTRGQELAGLALIGLGLLFLASNLGWLGWFNWALAWPVLLILIGVAVLMRNQSHA